LQEHWSIEEYKNYKEKKSKYKAKKTSIDGHSFDSIKEANYYEELKLLLKAGEIRGFCIQPTFILAPNLKYKADFIVFNNDGSSEIIDVKELREYIQDLTIKVKNEKVKDEFITTSRAKLDTIIVLDNILNDLEVEDD